MSEPTFHFKPHPAAKQWLTDKGLPADADPQLVCDQQMLWYGDKHVGYCGYKPGDGVCFVAHQDAPFVALVKAFFLEKYGVPPKRIGNLPPAPVSEPDGGSDE